MILRYETISSRSCRISHADGDADFIGHVVVGLRDIGDERVGVIDPVEDGGADWLSGDVIRIPRREFDARYVGIVASIANSLRQERIIRCESYEDAMSHMPPHAYAAPVRAG